jgi:hypothetical protein
MTVKKYAALSNSNEINQNDRMSLGSKIRSGGMVGLAILLGTPWSCLGATEDPSVAAVEASAADGDANPYSVIAQRNVFGLNPPPPAPEPDKGPPLVLPVVHLSGFMRKGEQWKALLAVEVENPDPHGHPLSCYLTLAEGDKKSVGSGAKQAAVELVKAYAEQEKVDIINSGTAMTLSAKDKGKESPAPAAVERRGSVVIRRPRAPAAIPAALPATEGTPAARDPGGAGNTLVGAPPGLGSGAPVDRAASKHANIIIAGGAGGTAP